MIPEAFWLPEGEQANNCSVSFANTQALGALAVFHVIAELQVVAGETMAQGLGEAEMEPEGEGILVGFALLVTIIWASGIPLLLTSHDIFGLEQSYKVKII